MSTLTDDGLEWLGQKTRDAVSTRIDAIAIGTGQNETRDASSLGNQVYRSDYSASNVEFVPASEPGSYEGRIEVQGGTEVAAKTSVSEIGIYAGGAGGGGVLVGVDAFEPIEIGAGHTERFSMPVIPSR